MNVLEKILEEIEEATFQEDAPIYAGDKEIDGYVRESVVKEIICSHMNNLQDADAEEKPILCTVGEDGMLTSYDDTYDVIIHCSNKEEQDQTIELIKSFDWVPVSERLPEENGYYLITVKELNYGEHVTMSFFDKYDMRGWQHVHMVNKKVTAWKSLPEPYKGE